jgi:hypothetical protein
MKLNEKEGKKTQVIERKSNVGHTKGSISDMGKTECSRHLVAGVKKEIGVNFMYSSRKCKCQLSFNLTLYPNETSKECIQFLLLYLNHTKI